MNSNIDDYLNEVDQWKHRVHEQLKGLTPKQRAAFWARVGQKARRIGLPLTGPVKRAKPRTTRVRRTG